MQHKAKDRKRRNGSKGPDARVSRSVLIILLVIIVLALFLRLFNTSDLSGGDDSQWAELSMFAIKDPVLMIYPHMPDEPISWKDTHNPRPFATWPYILSILVFGYTALAIAFPAALFSALSIIFLFKLLKRFFDDNIALLACFLFAVSPFHLAFTRIGILDSALIFYSLAALWLLIRGLDEKRPLLIYFSALVWFINITTTNIRGAVPILAVIPCLYFYLMRHRFTINNLKSMLKNRLFHHFMISHIAIIVVFVIYIAIPLLWGNSGWWDLFILMLKNAAGTLPNRTYLSPWAAAKSMLSLLIYTPFIGLIFIPAIAGIITALIKLKDVTQKHIFRYLFWLFYIIGIVFFYLQGQFAPQRQLVFMPAIITFAALGIVITYYSFVKNKKHIQLPIVLAASFGYLIFMLFQFSRSFPNDFAAVSSIVNRIGLGFLLNLTISYWWLLTFIVFLVFVAIYYLSTRRQPILDLKKIYFTIITVFLAINLILSIFLVTGGIGVYKRTTATGTIADYLNNNLEDQKYSCVAGVHDKSFAFYTQRPCAFWVQVDTTWLDQQAKQGNIKYFILNTHHELRTPGVGNIQPDGTLGAEFGQQSDWSRNHPEKLAWLNKNTVEITDKIGIDKNEFKIYELSTTKTN